MSDKRERERVGKWGEAADSTHGMSKTGCLSIKERTVCAPIQMLGTSAKAQYNTGLASQPRNRKRCNGRVDEDMRARGLFSFS